MSIKNLKLRWESNKDVVIKVFILALIILAAFGVGYIMGQDSSPAPIIIEKASWLM